MPCPSESDRSGAASIATTKKKATPRSVGGGGEEFDEGVEEGLAFVEGLDEDAFVAAVEADVVAVDEDALDAVGGDAGFAGPAAIGSAHNHGGNDGNAGPDFFGDAARGAEHVGA